MIIEHHLLDLECDNPNCKHGMFGPVTLSVMKKTEHECSALVEYYGWTELGFTSTGRREVYCPACSKEKLWQ